MYHTQEKRGKKLSSPIKCYNDYAWLGVGYYFWYDLEDAIRWGNSAKTRTGKFEIYSAKVRKDNILDTVFNQEHYEFWLKQIEKVAKNILKKSGLKPTIKEINEYFVERGTWSNVDGIQFQDVPTSRDYLLVRSFYYRKRIQLVLYKEDAIISFSFYDEMECVQC